MGIGAGIFLIAVGAIMTFAIEVDSTNDFNINNAGVILMVIGALGIAISMLLMAPRRRRAVVERQPDRTVYTEDVV